MRAALGYLLIIGCYFHEVATAKARFIDRDLVHFFYPLAHTMAQAWQGSGSFLWDSSLDHGLPLLARWMPAVFYPASWLVALWPVDVAYALAILVHFFLAALAMFALARRYTTRFLAAWLAGLSYAFSGILLSLVGCGTYFFAAALLPLSVLLLHRLLEERSLINISLLALVLALQVFIPDPQTLFGLVLVIFPAVFVLRAPAGKRRPALAALALCGILALGLSFCQLWPTLELAGLSERAGGIDFTESTIWSFHPLRLLEVVIPQLFGTFTPEHSFWATALINAPVGRPWATMAHLGLVPLVALLLLSVKELEQRRRILCWGGCCLLYLLMALGQWTPFYRAFYALPGVDRFRYPEKFFLLFTLGLSLLGAMGLDRLAQRLEPASHAHESAERRFQLGLLLLLLLLVGARLVLFCNGAWISSWVTPLQSSLPAAAITSQALGVTATALERCAAIALALLLLFHVRRRLGGLTKRSLLLVIVIADLASAGLSLRLLGGRSWLASAPRLCQALSQAGSQAGSQADSAPPPLLWRSGTIAYPRTTALGVSIHSIDEQRRWEWNTLRPNIGTGVCVRHVDGYGAPELRQHGQLLDALLPTPERLLDVLGVQWVIAPPGQLPPSYRRHSDYAPWGVALYKNDGLPLTYALGQIDTAQNLDAAIHRLAQSSFPYRTRAVFEDTHPFPSFGEARRVVRLLRHTPGRIELQATFDEPGYLVLLESYYPGWLAQINGQPTRLWRANGAFLGLTLPRGPHRVVLTFTPARQRQGNMVSIGTGLLLVLLIALELLGRRGLGFRARLS